MSIDDGFKAAENHFRLFTDMGEQSNSNCVEESPRVKQTAFLLCLGIIAPLVQGSESASTDIAVRKSVFQQLFTPETLSANSENVMLQINELDAEDSYQRLAEWVLPSTTHANLRLDGYFAKLAPHQKTAEPVFQSPAIALVKFAAQTAKIAELETVLDGLADSESVRGCNLAAMRVLVALEKSDPGEAREHAATIDRLFEIEPVEARFAVLTAGFASLDFPAVRDVVFGVVRDEQLRILARPVPIAESEWAAHIATLSGLAQYRAGKTEAAQFGTMSLASNWSVVSPANSVRHSEGWLGTHWQQTAAKVTSFSGNAQNMLIYRQPLRGEFEVTGRMSDYAFNPVQIMYAGRLCEVHPNRSGLSTGNLRLLRDEDSAMKLPKPSADVPFSLRVSGDVATLMISGQIVWSYKLSPEHDPWFAFRCAAPSQGWLRDVKIHGTPVVPDTVQLITDARMNEWLPWFGELVGDHNAAAEWRLSADDGETKLVGQKRNDLHGTQCGRLLSHYRPMMEDGAVDYEFFYQPGVSSAHPAIGDLAFLVQPNEVVPHHVTNEVKSNLEDTSQSTSDGRPQLKLGDWNSARLELSGSTVKLSINGSIVFASKLPIRNARTFGLFYFCDETDLQVRNISWRGEWKKTLPSIFDQELASDEFRELDDSRKRLQAVFSHNFVTEGTGEDYFVTKTRKGAAIVATEAGILGSANVSTGFVKALLMPAFELQGDFDIIASFDQFSGEGAKESGARLNVLVNGGELRTTRTRSGNKEYFKSVRVDRIQDKRKQQGRRFATGAASGRLRLARRGTEYTMRSQKENPRRFS